MRRGCRNLNVQEIANLDGLGGDAVLARVAELANRAAVFFDLVDDLGVALADGRLDNVQSSLKALKFKNKENQKKKYELVAALLASKDLRQGGSEHGAVHRAGALVKLGQGFTGGMGTYSQLCDLRNDAVLWRVAVDA